MKRVGIIGAGQLGLMLGQAGKDLDLEFTFLDPAENSPAARVGNVLPQPFDSSEGLSELAKCDVVTYEFENVPVEAIETLNRMTAVFPSARALHYAQDRLNEKKLFQSLDIPVPAWHPVSSAADLDEAIRVVGLPLLLKTRRFGYDGKGQFLARRKEDAEHALKQSNGVALIAEQLVAFDREVSIIGARSTGGETVVYPLTENEHQNGILRLSKAPAEGTVIAELAARYLHNLLDHLDYVGVLALELFAIGDRLLANEFAPRVHNSGHWTIEGAKTSQFENHLRAGLGLSLGATSSLGHAGMINVIGEWPQSPQRFRTAGFYLHDYGKSARPGRKLGHLTVLQQDAAARNRDLQQALKLLEIPS